MTPRFLLVLALVLAVVGCNLAIPADGVEFPADELDATLPAGPDAAAVIDDAGRIVVDLACSPTDGGCPFDAGSSCAWRPDDAGCGYIYDGGDRPDVGTPDAGDLPDVGSADSGLADSGLADVGLADSGLADIGSADVGSPDVGSTDVGSPDTGDRDVGVPDVGAPNVGAPDVGSPDVGSPDVGTPDVGETPDIGCQGSGCGPADIGAPCVFNCGGDAGCPACEINFPACNTAGRTCHFTTMPSPACGNVGCVMLTDNTYCCN